MKNNWSCAVMVFFFTLGLLTVCLVLLVSCRQPETTHEPVHRKPLYVNDKWGSFGENFCDYQLYDADGNQFSITDYCNKYSVGDSIK